MMVWIHPTLGKNPFWFAANNFDLFIIPTLNYRSSINQTWMDLLASEFLSTWTLQNAPSLFQKNCLPSCTLKKQLLRVGPRLYKASFHIPMELLLLFNSNKTAYSQFYNSWTTAGWQSSFLSDPSQIFGCPCHYKTN